MTDTHAPSRIPQSFIRDLVDRTDIVEIVRQRVELKKKGDNYQGRCPFHDEKTPSFTVSDTKQFYYCFGCGAHGNVLEFLKQYDRMEFLDAIDYLASRHGIEIPKIEGYTPDRSYDALFPLMQRAATYYYQQLTHYPEAIEYLKARGLTGQMAKLFSIGFAPPGWDNLQKALGNDPKVRSYLTSVGMLIDRDTSSCYDRFRNRIMFPIHDLRGRVIAFGGRTMTDEQPKYLNSPETPIFHKGQELYGLYQARQANQKLERLIIVEGYMDVISLFQHGITYAVATLGTAINSKHLQKCLRFTDDILFCFDGDSAGRHAAWKALTIAMPLLRDGANLKFLFLKDGDDPDSLIQKQGRATFEKLIADALPLQTVFFETLTEQHPGNSPADKAALAKSAKEYINQMPQGIYQELLYDELATLIGVSRDELARTQSDKPRYQNDKPARSSPTTLPKLTRHCISLLLQEPNLAAEIAGIEGLHESTEEGHLLLLKLLHIFKEHPGLPVGQLLTHWDDPQEQALIAQLAATELSFPKSGFSLEFKDTVQVIEKNLKQQQMNQLIDSSKNRPLTQAEKEQLTALQRSIHKH